MNEHLLETAVSNELTQGHDSAIPTEDDVRDAIARYRRAIELDDEAAERVFKRILTKLRIDLDLGISITTEDFAPWLDEAREDIKWGRWLSYKQMLLNEGRAPRVVDVLERTTDEILEYVGNPRVEGSWSRRGLVIGDVQSGKTSTYLGVLNKAADAGYKLIIVLAGGTELLRQQTQERVDEGFIGLDSRLNITANNASVTKNRAIGVGRLDQSFTRAQGMTTYYSDFRKKSNEVMSFSIDEMSSTPHIFVLKKNKSVLKAVTDWLSQQPTSAEGKLTVPMLVLDDESDYASVNTREEEDPTAINDAIRGLLALSHRNSYLAFTATPFANIFIDHGHEYDLFPRDFIYSLEAPSNYVGAAEVFGIGDDPLPDSVVPIADAEPFFPLKHKVNHQVPTLPASLRTALRAFVVAGAIRDLREMGKPRSMLVNVSRFKAVQAQVHALVADEFAIIRNAVQLHAASFAAGEANAELEKLHKVFDEHFADAGHTWSEIVTALPRAVASTTVELFNSDRPRDSDPAMSKRAPQVIAVGGNVLSRGLTLEGLTVSYFYRVVGASDTLLQMARWFGYRDGYRDLTRLWIEPSVAADYKFVHESVEELRADLLLMRRQKLTPTDFGLAVKKHPESLLVTARNKMKAAETATRTVSLAGRRLETTKVSGDPAFLAANVDSIEQFLVDARAESPESPSDVDGHLDIPRVPKLFVANLLKTYVPSSTDPFFSDGVLARWIEQARSPHLQEWRVVVVSGSGPRILVGGTEVKAVHRRIDLYGDNQLRVSGSSARLAGSTDVQRLLPKAVQDQLLKEWKSDSSKLPAETYFYRSLPSPVLMLYPLVPQSTDEGALELLQQSGRQYIGALKVAIPGASVGPKDTSTDVKYVINSVAKRLWSPELTEGDADDIG